jgi:hypothetical protein
MVICLTKRLVFVVPKMSLCGSFRKKIIELNFHKFLLGFFDQRVESFCLHDYSVIAASEPVISNV